MQRCCSGRSYIVWQEVLDNDIEISNDTIVQVRPLHLPAHAQAMP